MNGSVVTNTFQGQGAVAGLASGPAHVISMADDALSMPKGAILVTRIVHPHMAPLMAGAAAVVLEEASLLQHATTLAREFGVPAVVGIKDATQLIRTGDALSVDGLRGLVRHQPGAPTT